MSTAWKDKIIAAFTERYPASKASGGGKNMVLNAMRIFADFDKAPPDERESFLEACESLETEGLIFIKWEKHSKKEKIKSLVMNDSEIFFLRTGITSPSIIAEGAKNAARAALSENKVNEKFRAFFEFISENINAQDAALGIDENVIYDAAKLFALCTGEDQNEILANITLRSLSVKLYADSKRLEYVVHKISGLLSRATRAGIYVPPLLHIQRSFPDTLIAGRFRIIFKNQTTPLENATGSILGLPLETIKQIQSIELLDTQQPIKDQYLKVLTVENKETFYVLSSKITKDLSANILIYSGGHPNNAVSALVQICSSCGAEFFHAGDLDPDGILILQEIASAAGKTVAPVRMDCQTFNQYKAYTRALEKTMITRLKTITEATLQIEGIGELCALISETERGLEQEIIEY